MIRQHAAVSVTAVTLAAALAAAPAGANAGDIAVVAETGLAGYGGDGNAATVAQLFAPHGVALDISGNVFIADPANNRIRRVDGATGTISTFAGTGTAGSSGDGGPASAAELNGPRDVAVDSDGDVFFADTANNEIRRIDHSTFEITRVVGSGSAGFSGDGGLAVDASLNGPQGIAVNGSGVLAIADTGNSRIRRVDPSTHNISAVAGTGTAGVNGDGLGPATQLNGPVGVSFVDPACPGERDLCRHAQQSGSVSKCVRR